MASWVLLNLKHPPSLGEQSIVAWERKNYHTQEIPEKGLVTVVPRAWGLNYGGNGRWTPGSSSPRDVGGQPGKLSGAVSK